eukprot:Gb_37792 [translate_table: standard]
MAKEGNNIPWKMSKTCRGCNLKCWQTHTKWTLNNFSFFKVMMGNFSSFLEIPSEFANQMQYPACKDAILEGPSGHLWHIHLCCIDSLPSFKDGWESFVSDHCIQSQDTLVFKHIIDTHFSVQIFEPSGNEKLSTYSIENHGSCCLKMGDLSKICNKRRCTTNRGKPIESSVILEDAFENIKIERLIGEQVGYAEAPIILVDEREVSDQVSSANTHDQGAIETCDLFHKKPSWHEDLESTVSTKRSGPSFSLVMKKTAVSNPFWLGSMEVAEPPLLLHSCVSTSPFTLLGCKSYVGGDFVLVEGKEEVLHGCGSRGSALGYGSRVDARGFSWLLISSTSCFTGFSNYILVQCWPFLVSPSTSSQHGCRLPF